MPNLSLQLVVTKKLKVQQSSHRLPNPVQTGEPMVQKAMRRMRRHRSSLGPHHFDEEKRTPALPVQT